MKNYKQIYLYRQSKWRLRTKCANNRARRKGIIGRFTEQTVENLYVKQKGRCACCGILLEGVFEIDHIKAISKGGDNTPDNLQLLTPMCNRLKADMSMEDYLLSKESKNA